MSLNGASQKVVLSQLPLYEQHPHRTFEAWFQTAQPTAVQTIYCAGIIGPDSAVWYKTPSSAGPGVGYYAAPNTPWLNCSASFSSLQNEWHHLAAVTSASSGFVVRSFPLLCSRRAISALSAAFC